MVWGGQQFFNDLLRKYIIVFGRTFENTTIIRETSNTALGGNTANTVETTAIKVPLTYSPKDKMFVRLTQDADIDRPDAVLLPRMSFEIAGGLVYDPNRKLTSIGRNVQRNVNNVNNFLTQYNPAPYDIPINLYIYSKYQSDAAKILEPILAFFTPEFTPSVEVIPAMNMTIDVPIVIGQPRLEDTYDGKFPDRRILIWTVPFTMKACFYGPIIPRPMIKFTHINVYADHPYSNIGVGIQTSEYINSTQSSISFYNSGVGALLPQTGNSSFSYLARIDNEMVNVTGGFGTNTVTVTRAQGNTIANGHLVGALFTPVNQGNFDGTITTQPGLLANGAPTTSVNDSISWTLIDVSQDYGFAREFDASASGEQQPPLIPPKRLTLGFNLTTGAQIQHTP